MMARGCSSLARSAKRALPTRMDGIVRSVESTWHLPHKPLVDGPQPQHHPIHQEVRMQNKFWLISTLVAVFLAACSSPISPSPTPTGTTNPGNGPGVPAVGEPDPNAPLPTGFYRRDILLPGADKAEPVVYQVIAGRAVYQDDMDLGAVDADGFIVTTSSASGSEPQPNP